MIILIIYIIVSNDQNISLIFFMCKIDPMSGCDICLVITLPPRDSTLQNKRCVHLKNNFPCIKTLVIYKVCNATLHYFYDECTADHCNTLTESLVFSDVIVKVQTSGSLNSKLIFLNILLKLKSLKFLSLNKYTN